MNSLVRDLAIFFGLLLLGLVFNVYRLVTSRGRRRREVAEATAARQALTTPSPDLAQYAASQGWAGPATDPSLDGGTASYVEDMVRAMHGAPRGVDVPVSGPLYANVFTGQAGGHAFSIGNAWMGIAGKNQPGSFCVLHLGEMLPPLFVNLRRYRPPIRMFLKDVPFESERFNRQFQVLALDREYATAVITERTMAILLERDDWVFYLEFLQLVCVSRTGLATAQDYAARLDAVVRFANLIPHFVHQDRGLQMPTLPDGTVLDPSDPASRDRFKAAFVAMPPEQRAAFVAQARVQGARFVAGMLGKDLPPGLEERLRDMDAGHAEAGDPGKPEEGGTDRG